MAKKELKSGGLATLIRNAGLRAKTAAEATSGEGNLVESTAVGRNVRIFDILTFIEASWGLGMSLYPVQRFIVKLYYNIPLDDTQRTIIIKDWATQGVKYSLTELQYLQYLYGEGRCNIKEQDRMRRQLLLSIGRRAGKCVSGDTLVLTDRGIYPIEDLGEAPEEGFSASTVGVIQEGARRSQASAFYNGGVKQTFKVKTDSGYTVTGTGNHRVKVMASSGRVEWKYLDEIQPGDHVALNRTTDLWASKPLDLLPFHNEDGYKEVRLPPVLDERVGNLLGYLVGDGTWGDGHAVSVTVEHLHDLITEVLGEPRTQMDKRTANTGRLEFCSVRARRFLDALGWKQECARDQKMIPWAILRSPKSVVCSFLRGLFETDGCAESGGKRITLSSASFRLAHEVQVVLLNLGIVSNVSRKWVAKTKKHYAVLSLKGVRSRQIFAELVGFDSDKKRLPMAALGAAQEAQEGKSDTESIPHQRLLVRDWLESVPKRNSFRGELGWGRSKLREATGNVHKGGGEDLTYTKIRRALSVAKELPAGQAETAHFEEILRLDYFYDPVASVEVGEDQVYDLTVPDGGSFIANGMTNHNTTLSAIFASYELYRLLSLYSPQDYYGLPEGNRIQILSVATGKDQAALLFNDVTSHVSKCEWFQPFIANNTQTHVQFRTPYDIEKYGPTNRLNDGKFQTFNGKASIRLTFKPAISTSLRGAGNIVIILDEMAHFQQDGKSSAKEIYDAVVPSALAFSPKDPHDKSKGIGPVEARIIGISSPLNKAGKFYELHHFAMSRAEGSENIIAIQAPTWEVNPTVEPEFLRQKYHEDPAVFMTEYGAEFSDRVRGWIEREGDLIECIDADRRPVNFGPPRYPHQMGVDVGLIGDGTAVAITHVEGDQIVLDYHEVWTAGVPWRESNPHLSSPITDYAKTLEGVERLDFEEITKWIVALNRRFYITDGLFDRWNGIPLEQSLIKSGLKQYKSEFFTREARSRMFQAVKLLIFDKKVVLYNWPRVKDGEGAKRFSPMIEEILALQADQTAHNQILVAAPKIAGAHDDVTDAVVRAIWLSLETLQNQKHASRGFLSRGQPQGDSPRVGSSTQYQMRRARAHGVNRERMGPRTKR